MNNLFWYSQRITRITSQELQLKQLLQSEGISFEFQKVFSLPYCQYVVDFFLPLQTILECSTTDMLKYQVPLRKKAIYLEAKSSQLKQHFSDLSIWVLLETCQPIQDPFFQTLVRLMPSVDEILTSKNELLEKLGGYFRKNLEFHSTSAFSPVLFSLDSFKDPSLEKHCTKSFLNLSTQNYCPYIISKNEDCRQLIQQSHNFLSTKDNKNSLIDLRCSSLE